jgi:uncharacterized protein
MSCCSKKKKKKIDLLMWGSSSIVVLSYGAFFLIPELFEFSANLGVFSGNLVELFNKMAFGLILAIIFVGVLERIPREFVVSVLGKGGTLTGVLRATLAGVLLDLCSHGILLVGMKLYKRGASLGQVMAFLIASPWNSLSLTIILWSLIGFWWTLAFLLLSMLIAVVSGVIFDLLVKKKVLDANPNQMDLPKNYSLWKEGKKLFSFKHFSPSNILRMLLDGAKGSKMILRWIFFGVILASLIRTFVSPEAFETAFGPTLAGLGLTLVVATVLEVCSEGSAPIAADILTRAGSPGNSFAFLMTGVSTDYTEVMALKETTYSWKTAFFLPLVTLPQIIIISMLINQFI